jgi:hypothetical protein
MIAWKVDAHFCRERTDLVRTKHFLNLITGNRLVFSHADPGGKRAPLAALREFVCQALQSSALRKKAAKNPDERIRSAITVTFSAHSTEYRVE